MGRFHHFLTVFSACDMIMAGYYRFTFYSVCAVSSATCADSDHLQEAQSIIWAFALHSYIL